MFTYWGCCVKAGAKDVCTTHYVHEDVVARVKSSMKPDETFALMAEIFKVLGDPTRVKILYALLNSELCVCDISNLLKMSESAISHQLRILRNTRLVKYRKEGRIVYYSLADAHVKSLFKQGLDHAEE